MQNLMKVFAFAAVLLLGTVLNAQYVPISILVDGGANPATGGIVDNVAHPSLSPSGILAFDGDDEGTTLDDFIYVDGAFVVLSGDIVNIGGVPSTGTVDNIDDWFEPGHVNDSGDVVWDGDLDNTLDGINDDEVLMLNLDVIMQEGTTYPGVDGGVRDPGEWNSTCIDALGNVYAEVDMDLGATTDDEILVVIPPGGLPTTFMMNLFSEFREGSTIIGGALDGLVWDTGAFTDTNWNASGHMITDANLDEVNGVTTGDDIVLVRKLSGVDYELLAREGDTITLPLGQTPLIVSFQDPQIANNGNWVTEIDTDADIAFDNAVIGDLGAGLTVLLQEGQDVSAQTGIPGTVVGFIDATAINSNGRVLIACQVEDDGVNIPPYDELLLQYDAGVLTLIITNDIPIANLASDLVDIEGDNLAFNDLDQIYIEGDAGTNDGIFSIEIPAVFPVDTLVCDQTPGALSADLSWTIPAGPVYDGIRIFVDGVLETTLGSAITSYTTLTVPAPNVQLAILVEPFIGVDVAPAASCSAFVIAPRDVTECDTPALVLNDIGVTTDTYDFQTSVFIADLTLTLDVAHPDVDDYQEISLTSPSGTTVTVFAGNGPTGVSGMDTTFADFGALPDSTPYNIGAVIQPAGPGAMNDFRCENAQGVWTLLFDDQFTVDIGTLNEWCLNVYEEPNPAQLCCPDPSDLTCSVAGACGIGGLALSWTNNSTYNALELLKDDGVSTTTIPLGAGDTSYMDTAVVDGTAYTYTLRYQCAAGAPIQDDSSCTATPNSTFVPPVTDLVVTSDFCADEVTVTWNNGGVAYDTLQIFRAGTFLMDVTGLSSFVDTAPVPGPSSYTIAATCGAGSPVPTNGSVDHALAGLSDFVCTPETTNCDGTVTITWTNGGLYDTIDLLIDGVAPAVQPGPTDVTFTTAALSSGLHTIEMTPSCIAGVAATSTCDVTISVPPGGETDLILALEGRETTGAFDPGLVDSVSALSASLQSSGQTVYISAPPTSSDPDFTTELPCGVDLASFQRIWVLSGTFPDDYRLEIAENDLLGTLNRDNNIPVYLEASDHWGFQVDNGILSDRDGVGNEIAGTFDIDDGGDSFTQMQAVDSANGLNPTTLFPAPVNYSQDQTTSDFTDHLELAGVAAGSVADPDVATSGIFFVNNDDGLPSATDPDEAIPYPTAVYATNTLGAPVISVSWEFGGFALDPLDPAASDQARLDLAGLYLAAFGGAPPTDEFFRGDTNNDGGVNIADAIYLLGNLFPGANPQNVLVCLDAADTNNDGGINIADAISLLGSLFGSPAVPLPLPNVVSGCGPDTDVSLGCDLFDACP